jgi:hypothetical protein
MFCVSVHFCGLFQTVLVAGLWRVELYVEMMKEERILKAERCNGQSGTGAIFLRVSYFCFACQFSFQQLLTIHLVSKMTASLNSFKKIRIHDLIEISRHLTGGTEEHQDSRYVAKTRSKHLQNASFHNSTPTISLVYLVVSPKQITLFTRGGSQFD